jgi:hypothetical protein
MARGRPRSETSTKSPRHVLAVDEQVMEMLRDQQTDLKQRFGFEPTVPQTLHHVLLEAVKARDGDEPDGGD